MATSKQEWLIILPDHPNALEKRMEVRPKHLESLKPRIGAGTIVFGGASLEEPIKEGQGMKANGSALIVCCDTQQEAEEIVKSDIYASSGVWDLGRMQIMPFKSAVRKEL